MRISNQKAWQFFEDAKSWKDEYLELRGVILDTGLAENFKWMHPCYTFNGKNVVLIHGFKNYCALLFFKGALIEDTDKLLIRQTENVQAQRQIRFTSIDQINKLKPVIRKYLGEAIQIEKAGKKVEFKKTRDYEIPLEFQNRLDEDAGLKNAFESLTPGRQRAYMFYFSSAKQSKTRVARIKKHLDRILSGKGMYD